MPPQPSVFPHIDEPTQPSTLPGARGWWNIRRAVRFSSLSRGSLYKLMREKAVVFVVRCGVRLICRASLEAYLRDGSRDRSGARGGPIMTL